MHWWNVFWARLQDWVRRAMPYVQLGLHKAVRFAKTRRWFPGAVVSFLSAVVTAFVVDWPALGPILDRPAWWMTFAMIFFYFNALACRAFILWILMREQINYSQSLTSLNEGSLIDILMPLRLGDTGRAFLLARRLGLSMYQVRSAIRVERLYDILFAVALLMVSVLISAGAFCLKSFVFVLLALLVLLLFSLPLLAKRTDQLRELVKRALAYLSWDSPSVQAKVLALLDGLPALSDWQVFGESLFWSFLSWAFRVAGLFTLIKGVSPSAPFGYGIFAAALLALGTRIPSAPAALGVYAGAVILALALVGVDPTTALACALASHLIDILFPLLLGGKALLREGETLPALYEKLAGFY